LQVGRILYRASFPRCPKKELKGYRRAISIAEIFFIVRNSNPCTMIKALFLCTSQVLQPEAALTSFGFQSVLSKSVVKEHAYSSTLYRDATETAFMGRGYDTATNRLSAPLLSIKIEI